MAEEATLTLSRRRLRLLGLLILVGVVLWLARAVIGPFVVAAMLAYAFAPVVSAAQDRTGWPRPLVIGIGYGIFFAIVGALAYVLAERIGAEFRDLSTGHQDIVYSALYKLFGDSVVIAGNTYSVSDLSKQIHDAILGLLATPTDAVHRAAQAVETALQVVLCLIVTFYFLLDGRRFGRFCIQFLEPDHRDDALRIAHRIHVVLGRWLRGQIFLIGLVAAVLYVILGPLLHVRFALAIAVFSGVLEIVPLVGPVIAAGVAGTVAFATRGSDTTIVVLVVYILVRQIEDQVIMPLVIGRAVHLHPVITIFAVLLGLSTWGILGGLLAVPVAAALNVTLRELFPEETGDRGLEAEIGSSKSAMRWPGIGRLRRPKPFAARLSPADGPMARRDPAADGDRTAEGETTAGAVGTPEPAPRRTRPARRPASSVDRPDAEAAPAPTTREKTGGKRKPPDA